MKTLVLCALISLSWSRVDAFLKCFKPDHFVERPTLFSCSEEDVYYNRRCESYVIVRLRENPEEYYYCILPTDIYEILLTYDKDRKCSSPKPKTLSLTGHLSCPHSTVSGTCERYLQYMSGCYSFVLLQKTILKEISSPNLTFEVKNSSFAETSCQETVTCDTSLIPEFNIVEKIDPNESEGARYLMPTSSKIAVDCSEFIREFMDVADLSTCRNYGGPLRGPCFTLNTPTLRLLVPTMAPVRQTCPRGFYLLGCKCLVEGSYMETSECFLKNAHHYCPNGKFA